MQLPVPSPPVSGSDAGSVADVAWPHVPQNRASSAFGPGSAGSSRTVSVSAKIAYSGVRDRREERAPRSGDRRRARSPRGHRRPRRGWARTPGRRAAALPANVMSGERVGLGARQATRRGADDERRRSRARPREAVRVDARRSRASRRRRADADPDHRGLADARARSTSPRKSRRSLQPPTSDDRYDDERGPAHGSR